MSCRTTSFLQKFRECPTPDPTPCHLSKVSALPPPGAQLNPARAAAAERCQRNHAPPPAHPARLPPHAEGSDPACTNHHRRKRGNEYRRGSLFGILLFIVVHRTRASDTRSDKDQGPSLRSHISRFSDFSAHGGRSGLCWACWLIRFCLGLAPRDEIERSRHSSFLIPRPQTNCPSPFTI